MVTHFTIVRHGQTAENLAGTLQGWLDSPLDGLGRRQAQAVAERLASGKGYDLLFSSDLRRAAETAEAIGGRLGLVPRMFPALREWHLGVLEGRSCRELQKEFPEIMDSFLVDRTEELPVPGGESRNDFFARVANCLDQLAEKHAGKKLLLVTHGGVLRAIYRHVVGFVAPGRLVPQTTNGSMGCFCLRDAHWQMTCWNDCSHLQEVGFRDSVTF